MGDRTAFYKWLQLGDLIQKRADLSSEFQTGIYAHSPWSNVPGVEERGPSTVWRSGVEALFFIGTGQTARNARTEYYRFLTNFHSVAGFQTGFIVRGDLSIVEDSTRDGSVITAVRIDTPVAGSTEIDFTGTIGDPATAPFDVNDLVLLLDPNVVSGKEEVVIAGIIDEVIIAPDTTITVLNPVNTFVAGNVIARLEWHLPDASVETPPSVTGEEGEDPSFLQTTIEFSSGSVPVVNQANVP